jgi:hypothetical protein
MVCLHRLVHAEEITAFQGSKASFCVLMVEMGRIPFHGQLLYMSTSLGGGGFSGLGAGVGGGESFGRKCWGRLLILGG